MCGPAIFARPHPDGGVSTNEYHNSTLGIKCTHRNGCEGGNVRCQMCFTWPMVLFAE